MKDQSNLRTMMQMLVFTGLSITGVLLAFYGIYQFAITFITPIVANFTATIDF